MTWLTDEDRENQKRFNMRNDTPSYNFIFEDASGNKIKVYLKNGTQHDYAEKHNLKFIRMAYYGV